jgi:hypothetical protein
MAVALRIEENYVSKLEGFVRGFDGIMRAGGVNKAVVVEPCLAHARCGSIR